MRTTNLSEMRKAIQKLRSLGHNAAADKIERRIKSNKNSIVTISDNEIDKQITKVFEGLGVFHTMFIPKGCVYQYSDKKPDGVTLYIERNAAAKKAVEILRNEGHVSEAEKLQTAIDEDKKVLKLYIDNEIHIKIMNAFTMADLIPQNRIGNGFLYFIK